MNPIEPYTNALSRRSFLGLTGLGIGAMAARSLLAADTKSLVSGGLPAPSHFAPKAKRVIYLFQSGGPSHIDLFDYKPQLEKVHGEDLPDSIRQGQRLTGMTSGQKNFPVCKSLAEFKQRGASGQWISDLLPYTCKVADDIAVIRSMHTEAINHDPGITFINTGSQFPGNPSMGSWVSYGLGSMNENLPSYVVLVSQGTGKTPDSPSSPASGAAASCPRTTRASSSAVARIPCFTSTIPQAWRAPTAARCSTIYPHSTTSATKAWPIRTYHPHQPA